MDDFWRIRRKRIEREGGLCFTSSKFHATLESVKMLVGGMRINSQYFLDLLSSSLLTASVCIKKKKNLGMN